METELSKKLKLYKEAFYKEATAWFVEELGKISKEYNIYITNFGKLDISDIDGEEWYDGGVSGENQHELWIEVDDKIHELTEHLIYELEFKYQSFLYTKEDKIVY